MKPLKAVINFNHPIAESLINKYKNFSYIDVVMQETKQKDKVVKLLPSENMNSWFAKALADFSDELNKLYLIEDAKEQLDAILKCAVEGIEAVDNEGNVIFINPAFTRITGICPEERVGLNIFEVNPSGLLAKVLKTKKTYKGVKTTAPGRGGEVVANAAPVFRNGEMVGAVIMVYDITEQIELSKQLMRSESMLNEWYSIAGSPKYTFADMIGNSSRFRCMIELAKRAAKTDSPILIQGSHGTGKEMVAHAIHAASNRSDKPFLNIDCCSIPEHLFEYEFFGYEKNLVNHESRKKVGIFELANGGSIYIKNIDMTPLSFQIKLFKLFQEKQFKRIGGMNPVSVDVRIIASSSSNLRQKVNMGMFRSDLFYSLSVTSIDVPPLSERLEDIPLLVEYFINKYASKYGKRIDSIEKKALELLKMYHWPGNVRELANTIEYGVMVTSSNIILESDISPKLPQQIRYDNHIFSLERIEREYISKALAYFGATVEGKKKAAEALDISLATLYNKIKKYNL